MFKFSKKESVLGRFEEYSDKKIYGEEGIKDMVLENHKKGKYTKTFTTQLSVARFILDTIGIPPLLTIKEKIVLSNGKLKVKIETPPELKEFIEIKEVFECRQKGNKVEYSLSMEGTIKIKIGKGVIENLYITERLNEIRRNITSTYSPELNNILIPQ